VTLALTLGASLLAVWLDTRFTFLRPKTAASGLVHAAIGVFAVLGSAGLLMLVYGDISDAAFIGIVLGVFLPALTYALLTGLWMLRALANLTAARR
jgi:hypothetical protein